MPILFGIFAPFFNMLNNTEHQYPFIFEYIEERWIKYKGSPSGTVGSSEVLLSEDEDFVI